MAFELFGRTITPWAGVASIASAISPTLGLSVWPASTTVAFSASKIARLPSPWMSATIPVSSSAATLGAEVRRASRAAVCAYMSAISTSSMHPDRGRRGESRSRVVGVHVHLERRLVTDDEERVAEPPELLLERDGIETVALDDEPRAVPEARELLVDGVDPELGRQDGSGRDRLAVRRERRAAHDLDEPGASGIDDTGSRENVEELRRPLRARPRPSPALARGCTRAAVVRRSDARPPPPSRGSR